MKRLALVPLLLGGVVGASEQRPSADRPGWLATNELMRCSMYQQVTYGPDKTSGLLAAYFVHDFKSIAPLGKGRFVFYVLSHLSDLKAPPVVRINDSGPGVSLVSTSDGYESTELQAQQFHAALEKNGSLTVSINDESFGAAKVTFDTLGFLVANEMFKACDAAMLKAYK